MFRPRSTFEVPANARDTCAPDCSERDVTEACGVPACPTMAMKAANERDPCGLRSAMGFLSWLAMARFNNPRNGSWRLCIWHESLHY